MDTGKTGNPTGKGTPGKLFSQGKHMFSQLGVPKTGGGHAREAVEDYATSNKILNIKKETSSYTPISLQAGGRIYGV